MTECIIAQHHTAPQQTNKYYAQLKNTAMAIVNPAKLKFQPSKAIRKLICLMFDVIVLV